MGSRLHDPMPADEKILYRTSLPWTAFVTPMVLLLAGLGLLGVGIADPDLEMLGMIGLLLIPLGLVGVAARVLAYKCAKCAVTTKRVLLEGGLLRRHSLEIRLTPAEGTEHGQGTGGRPHGHVTILVAGPGGIREEFTNRSHPLEFRRQAFTG